MKKICILLFVCVAFMACTQQGETSLRVATYNLRMDTEHDSLNAWGYRKDNVKELIKFHNFDIVGTQEGFLHQLQGIMELSDYSYTGHGRDDGKDAGEHSAIIYKTGKFDIIDSGDFWLRETPDEPGKGWDATCCNRICSWAKFKEKGSGKEFYFFNVHFDHQGVVAREESGKLMVQKVKEIAQGAPAIVTGDFNSTPETVQIQTISAFLHNSREVSVATPYGPAGTFTHDFANPIGKQPIDYIFVSDPFVVSRYAVLTDNNGMYYPSDHLPVVTDLVLK